MTATEAKHARIAGLRGIAARLQSEEGGCERTDGGAGPLMHFLSNCEAAH